MKIDPKGIVQVQQVFEGFELLGYETRNKYKILDESGKLLGFAAEQQKGFFNFLFRQVLGHWRKFDVHFFDENRSEFLIAHHPFRFFFQRLEIRRPEGKLLGALQQRFAIINKKFDLEDNRGETLFEMRSPFWKIWTFPFYRRGNEVARISKKWSGLLSEAFTDRDNFIVQFEDQNLGVDEKHLILATSVFIDLQYFEKKANNRRRY